MPTAADYLNDLVAQRDSLASTLIEAGIEVEDGETFSTLVPKVNEQIRKPSLMEQYVTGQMTEYKNDKITKIGNYVFAEKCGVASIDCPNVTQIGEGAFLNNTDLKSFDFTNIANYQFGYACFRGSGLESVFIPSVNDLYPGVNSHIFNGCLSLHTVSAPGLTNTHGGDFSNCSALVNVDLPKLVDVSTYVFSNCTALQEIYLPSVRRVQHSAFSGCKNLVTVNLPVVETIAKLTFQNCTNLENVIVGPTLTTESSPISFSDSSKLSIESAKRIILALQDYSGTNEAGTRSIVFSSTTIALLEAEGATAPGDITWMDYIRAKGWSY